MDPNPVKKVYIRELRDCLVAGMPLRLLMGGTLVVAFRGMHNHNMPVSTRHTLSRSAVMVDGGMFLCTD